MRECRSREPRAREGIERTFVLSYSQSRVPSRRERSRSVPFSDDEGSCVSRGGGPPRRSCDTDFGCGPPLWGIRLGRLCEKKRQWRCGFSGCQSSRRGCFGRTVTRGRTCERARCVLFSWIFFPSRHLPSAPLERVGARHHVERAGVAE